MFLGRLSNLTAIRYIYMWTPKLGSSETSLDWLLGGLKSHRGIGRPNACQKTKDTALGQKWIVLYSQAIRRLTDKSREIGCYFDRIALKFDRHLGSAAAEVPVKFQSDWQSLNPNLVGFFFRDFTRSCSKTSVGLVNKGPGPLRWVYLSNLRRSKIHDFVKFIHTSFVCNHLSS